MKLANMTLTLRTSLCAALVLLAGCDAGESSVSSTVTEGGSGGNSDGDAQGCEIGEEPIALDIEVEGVEFPFDNAGVPCTVVDDGFDCDVDGTPTPVSVELAGTGPLPWADGDSVLVKASMGSTTIMNIVEVNDPQGRLLGLLIDGDPRFQSSVDIELTDAACMEDDNRFLALRAVYTLEDATLSILGAGEGVLETSDGVYRVRQEASGTSLGNPDQPDFVTATVLLEG